MPGATDDGSVCFCYGGSFPGGKGRVGIGAGVGSGGGGGGRRTCGLECGRGGGERGGGGGAK